MKQTIAIFIHDPICEVECALAMEAAFEPKFRVKLFGIEDLDQDFLETVDILAFPGGIGDADAFDDIFTVEHINMVRDFIDYGGKYLGICMGAYWAGSYYFDLLVGIEPVQYITRPTADIRTEYATTAKVNWQGDIEHMYFYDGCAFVGDTSSTEVIATYMNGDAMAIYQGSVGLMGCHLESEYWWHELDELEHWHGGYHNQLLCEFAGEL